MNIRERLKNADWSKYFPVLVICFGLAGVVLMFYATKWGPGFIDWDSFNYIAVARNLAQGRGYVFPQNPDSFLPLRNFPPVYPTLLAGFEVVGVDAVDGARILNAILFGLSTVIICLTVKRATGSYMFSIFVGILHLLSGAIIFYYAFALAEGLYMFFTLLGFWLLLMYIDDGRKFQLVLAMIVLSLSALTRYVGVANIITAVFVLLFYYRKNFWRKMIFVGVVAVISLAPLFLWMNRGTTETTADPEEVPASISERLKPSGIRRLRLPNFTREEYLYMFLVTYHTTYKWYLPERVVVGQEKVQFSLAMSAILVGIVTAFLYGRRIHNDSWHVFSTTKTSYPSLVLYGSFIFIYSLFIILVTMFAKVVVVERVYIPMLPASVIFVTILLAISWKTNKIVLRALTILVSLYLIVFFTSSFLDTVPKIHDQGLGLGRKSFYNSTSMNLLNELVQTETVYSNYPWALYLHTGEIGYRLQDFSPDEITEEVIVAIFTYESIKNPEFAQQYKEYLELLESDRHISVYRFHPRKFSSSQNYLIENSVYFCNMPIFD